MRKLLLILVLLPLFALTARATHMSGGEIYWECIGPNQYRITMVIYRDCFGINVDPTYTLQVQSPCGNTTMVVSTPGGTEISQLCDIELPNSTCNGGNLPGIQQYIYTGTITLQPCNFYTISYTNIYRNAAIVNLSNPGAQRTYIRATINTAAAPCNDSPQFTNTAIPYVCLGYPITYSFGAFDPEGDSLSYELIPAMGIAGNPLNYVNPHSGAQPIPGLTLDPATGEVNFTLSQMGNWVVAVRVNHWVNGQIVGTVMRDMQFVAYPCDNIPPDPTTGLVENLSGGATQTGPRAIELCASGDFCFDMVISDPNANNVLTAFSNVALNMQGATFSYTGTNPITATVCWEAYQGSNGFYPFIVNVNDGACPIPAFQTYIYSVRVLPGTYGILEVVDESCPDSGDGSLSVDITAGIGPFEYAWNTGSSEPSIMGTAGEYSVIITDANGCESQPLNGAIGTAQDDAEADAGADMNACIGVPVDLTGSIVNASTGLWSGGTGTFSGNWPAVQYTPTLADAQAGGTYLVLTAVPNGPCPSASDSLFLNVSNAFADASISGTDALCNGAADGTATFLPNDPDLTYLWNDAATQTTAQATGLAAGNYTVEVMDAFGCEMAMSITIGEPEALIIADLSAMAEGCLGDGDGSATVVAAGGTAPYTYTWSNGGNTATISVVSDTYTVTVGDANGCAPVTGDVFVGAQGIPNEAYAGPDLIGCMSALPVTLGGNVTNATSGTWSGGSGTITGTWPAFQYMPSAADIQNGSVELTLTTVGNTSCPPATDAMTILLPNSFANAALDGTDALCAGAADGTATFTPSVPGLTYLWNDPAAQTTATATGLAAGFWSVQVSDGFGCDTLMSILIGEPEPLTIGDLATTNETCAGDSDGTVSATVSGGTAPYTYAWDNGGSTATITVPAGTYSLSVTDANGCTAASASTTVDATGQPNLAFAGPDLVGCLNALPVTLEGSVQSAPDGVWSGGSGAFLGTGTVVQYQPSVNELLAGGVILTLTTVGNTACPPASDEVYIALSNSFLNAALTSTGASCNSFSDGSIAFAPDLPGNTYLWSDPMAQTSATATGLPAGTWSVTVTDALGCDTTLSAAVVQPDELVVAQVNTADAVCNGQSNGSASLMITGGTPGFNVSWSNGGNGTMQNGLAAGTYTATVTDAQGCSTQATAIIAEPSPITLTAQAPDTVCVNAPVDLGATASGGTGNLVVNWAGLGTGMNIQASFASSQNVVVTVVDQAGCTGPMLSLPIAVLDLNSATLNAYGGTTVCPGGSATVGATLTGYPGAYTLTWPQLGAFGQGPFQVPVTADIDLVVTATDVCANNLSAIVPLRLDVLPVVQLPAIIAEGCAPLTVQMPTTVTGSGLTYLWQLGNGNTSGAVAPVVEYQAGSYEVQLTVTTAFGCSATGSTTGQVIAHLLPTASFTADPWSTSIAEPTIHFQSQVTGPVSIYAWTFGDGGTGNVPNPLYTYSDVGTFPVELWVQDINGCTAVVERNVQITPVYDVTIPTAFTPNPNGGGGGGWIPGDLSNDVFYPFVEHVEDFLMRIYNRWGELIFESNDLRRGWDGYYRGQLSPQDVYVVQTWVRFVDGQEVQKLSDLTLFR
jgi:PKD repeat protein